MDLAEHIQSNFYLRERLQPQPGDVTYLHLSDLRYSVDRIKTDQAIQILDYGCGGSPYRLLFPNASYKRADFLQADGDKLDYQLTETGAVAEKDGCFDLIISTQVLEHVREPANYLAECYRLLKPGGTLYLTTHGSYPDHACPYDFYRWTSDGLLYQIKRAGFSTAEAEKQTTGPRALFQEVDIHLESLRLYRRTPFSLLLTFFYHFYTRNRRWIHRMCDSHFYTCRVVRENLIAHNTYRVVAVLAKK